MAGKILIYQGVPCVSAEWYHPPGLQPGHGHVVIAATEVSVETNREAAGDIPDLGRSFRTTAAPTSAGGQVELAAEGSLELEDTDDVGRPPVVINHLFIDPEQGVVQEGEHAEGVGGLWRVALTDVRAFWTRGEVTMRANVLRDGSDRPAGSSTTGEIEPSLMLPETLHHSGRPWRAEELIKRCLTNLPGRPVLARFPNGVKSPINIEWDAMPAAEALATILRGSGLSLAYLISGKVAIYRAGGGIADLDELRKRNPSVLALGATPAYRPGSAVVVGGPTVRTATTKWMVPVVEDDEGVFRFFAAVLDGWGYPVLDALRDLTAQPSDAFKSVPGGTDALRKDRTRRLKRDLLRAYQAGNSFLWPWRDRAELNQTGAALPPLVLAARYGIAPLFQAGLDADYQAAIARTEAASAAFGAVVPSPFARPDAIDEERMEAAWAKFLEARGSRIAAGTAATDRNPGRDLFADSLEAIETSGSPHVRRAGTPTGDGLHLVGFAGDAHFLPRAQEVFVGGERLRDLRTRLISDRDRHAGLANGQALDDWLTLRRNLLAGIKSRYPAGGIVPDGWAVNFPLQAIPSDEYEIDEDHGIVRFTRPAGLLVDVAVPQAEGHVLMPARVDAFYGVQLGDRFRAWYARSTGGMVLASRDRLQPGAQVPEVIRDDGLVLRVDADGADAANTGMLAVATRAAARVFRQRPVLKIVRPVLEGFHNLSGTAIIGIAWVSDGDTAQTKIGVNSGAPIDGSKMSDALRIITPSSTRLLGEVVLL